MKSFGLVPSSTISLSEQGYRLLQSAKVPLTFFWHNSRPIHRPRCFSKLHMRWQQFHWETLHTFLPTREKCSPREWENQNRYWQTGFYGRGHVQITGLMISYLAIIPTMF